MKFAIIGLPNSGKTTVFNALTRGTAKTAAFSSGRLEPNLATVKVPDPRLDVLKEIYQPRKVSPAEVQYVDVNGFSGEDRGEGLSPEMLGYIGTADALLLVVGAFEDDRVPHPLGSVDPARDFSQVQTELILSDLMILERRLERLEKELKKMSTRERESRAGEKDTLVRLKDWLENEQPLHHAELTPAEEKSLRGYNLLTLKPLLVVMNVGEDQISDPPLLPAIPEQQAFSAKVEAELAQMEDNEAAEFMEALGIAEAARDKIIRASYQLLGLISFLTVGEDEVKAWTIRGGTVAVEAGGVIHSDIQRGFIRAEVVPFEDLARAGSMAAARKQGLVRLEGKDYVLQDGDISHFLFNV